MQFENKIDLNILLHVWPTCIKMVMWDQHFKENKKQENATLPLKEIRSTIQKSEK